MKEFIRRMNRANPRSAMSAATSPARDISRPVMIQQQKSPHPAHALPRISIEDGAHFQGRIEIGPAKSQAAAD